MSAGAGTKKLGRPPRMPRPHKKGFVTPSSLPGYRGQIFPIRADEIEEPADAPLHVLLADEPHAGLPALSRSVPCNGVFHVTFEREDGRKTSVSVAMAAHDTATMLGEMILVALRAQEKT